MPSRSFLAALLLAALGSSTAAQAQPAIRAGTAGLRGSVLSVPGDRPVAGAVVAIAELQRSVHTDTAGAFDLAGLAPGSYALTVRKLGFAPLDTRITLVPGRVLEADLELRASIVELEEVAVRAQQPDPTGFGERMRTSSGGQFLPRAALDSVRGRPLHEVLLKRMRGVKVIPYGSTGPRLLASSRGQTSFTQQPRADPADSRSPAACFSQVWVDDTRVYAPGQGQAVPDLQLYDISRLEAVEFYAGPSTTPARYAGTGAICGTLVLWTRRN